MTPRQKAQPQTVGIRELKQNPSEIIAKASSGVRFEVLSNGKHVGVVIQRDSAVRSRWVGTDALIALSAAALPGRAEQAGTSDTTGWAHDLRAERERERDRHGDQIVDPWDTASRAVADPAD
jgi:antitoxin (DNA-binding transcriptional repressor) of toxin-antitoxin stability system